MPVDQLPDYYATLGVAKKATTQEIRRAFVHAAKKYHPDHGGSAQKMQDINEAYEILHDEGLRAEYDAVYSRYENWQQDQQQQDQEWQEEQVYQDDFAEETSPLYYELSRELDLIRQAKKMARTEAVKGFLWLVGGVFITGIGYGFASSLSTYLITWGAMIFGGFQCLRGLYYFFNPHALLIKSLGDNAPRKYQQKNQAFAAMIKVAGIGLVMLLVAGTLAGILSTTRATFGSKGTLGANNIASANTQTSSQQVQKASLDLKKQEYDSCVADFNNLSNQLHSVNTQLNAYDGYHNTAAYNALVPQQNALVAQYNAKRKACDTLRSDYNAQIDAYNSQIKTN